MVQLFYFLFSAFPEVVIFWSYTIGHAKVTSGALSFNKMYSSFMPSVAEQLFKDIEKVYQETSRSKRLNSTIKKSLKPAKLMCLWLFIRLMLILRSS